MLAVKLAIDEASNPIDSIATFTLAISALI